MRRLVFADRRLPFVLVTVVMLIAG